MSIDWPRFASLIRSKQRIVLTSHIRPDCDALGSELGMARVLQTLGKEVAIVNGHATPPTLDFIDPKKELKTLGDHVSVEEACDRDLLLILDTSSWAQLGPMGEVVKKFRGEKAVLDHHAIGDDLSAELFKDATAEATGRLVVDAADALEVKLTAEMAVPLFAAIATDTGWFRFPSTSAGTYRCAARLIDAGAKPDAIYKVLYEQSTLGRVKLRGLILGRIESELNGRLAHTFVRWSDFAATGAIPPDTEDVINTALSISGTEVAVIFVEQEGGGAKISFRSRTVSKSGATQSEALDCSKLAAQFGGGGHKAAAGASVVGDWDTLRAKVLDAVRAAMQ